jgi:hypothetical protein
MFDLCKYFVNYILFCKSLFLCVIYRVISSAVMVVQRDKQESLKGNTYKQSLTPVSALYQC